MTHDTILTDNERVSDAVELAAVTMPEIYRDVMQPRVADRLLARIGLSRRPSKFKPSSYRGQEPPNLLATLGKIGEYQPDPTPLSTYEMIRHYAVVKLGLVARAAPTFTALREVKVDGSNLAINEFVRQLFVDEWLVRLANQCIIQSYVFGASPNEVVWASEKRFVEYIDESGEKKTAWNGPALVFGDFRFIHPLSLLRIEINNKTKDYEGLVQVPPAGKNERLIPASQTFHYVNNFVWAGLWGESELRSVYPFWYYSEFFRALQADYLRFKAVPPIIGYAPPGTRVDDDGTEVDNMQQAGLILQQAYSNLVIVLPDERDDRGNQRWTYKELTVGQYSDVFTKAIEELEVSILRALLVPERTITQNMAAVGSYNQADAHAERMVDMAKLEVDYYLQMVNEHLVPKLVEDHFGPDAPPVRIFAQGTSEAFKEKLQSIILTVLQNDKTGFYAANIAFRELLDFINIPVRKDLPNGLPVPVLTGDAQEAPADNSKEENKKDKSDTES